MSGEINAHNCDWCSDVILVDSEEHSTDSEGNVYHTWCREDAAAEAKAWREDSAATDVDIEEEA